jgi:cell division septation protein DedD
MKRTRAVLFAGFSVVLFFTTGASVWEGAAAVSAGGELPDTGLYVATDSFPRNTVVDITNLENGKTVRGIVATALGSPGLLALISKEGAQAIGLQSRFIGRIRMSQPVDPVSHSMLSGEYDFSGDPDFDPGAALKTYGTGDETPSAGSSPAASPDRPARPHFPPAESKAPAETGDESSAPSEGDPGAVEETPETIWYIPEETPPAETKTDQYVFVPAPERPPEALSELPDNRYFIDPIPGPAARPPKENTPAPSGKFNISWVDRLEYGKYYLQLGAFSRVEAVESAIEKIEKTYPLAVQYIGSPEHPMYRVLVGPINHGESGALLQRFKGKGYKDAFIRKGE